MDDINFGESNGIWFHTHVKGWEQRNEDTISCHWSKNKYWQTIITLKRIKPYKLYYHDAMH